MSLKFRNRALIRRLRLQKALIISNGQRVRRIDVSYLRRVTRALLDHLLPAGAYDLAIHLVAEPEITRLNEQHLGHKGPTDVITFDYGGQQHLDPGILLEPGASNLEFPVALHGEIFVCIEVAIRQARRFRTTWKSEVIRYIIHGILHLKGFDDRRAADRRIMKREESRLLRHLSRKFDFSKL
jgi:probable rRNA maturation factor